MGGLQPEGFKQIRFEHLIYDITPEFEYLRVVRLR